MKYIVSLITSLLAINSLFSQQTSNWQNYTDKKVTKDIAISSDGIWAATEGGAYFYNPSTNSFENFSRAQGLFGTSLTAVGIDTYGKIWFGGSNGTIDVYDPLTKSFHSILDIYNNTEKTNKTINSITVSGDTVFISTDFGISLLNAIDYSFFDTFLRFGDFTSNIQVNSVFINNLIYAGTISGVAIQKSGATNLSAPESWSTYTQTDGLPSNTVNKIVLYNNSIIAATDDGLSIFNGSSWEDFLGITNVEVIDLLPVDNLLYILTNSKVYLYDGNSVSENLSLSQTPRRLAHPDNSGIIVATENGIFIDSTSIYPNGPAVNQFPYMTVDNSGNLWSSSGKDVSGAGFYKYNGTEWTNYNTNTYPELITNNYYSIFSSSDNSIYTGSWGHGFSKVTQDDEITTFNSENTKMIGIEDDTNFVVITGFAEDSKGNIWILNLRPADRNSLYVLTSDSIWSFRNYSEGQTAHSNLIGLVIDQNGTKWYYMSNEGTIGLYYFNEMETYDDNSDDVYGYISDNDGLTSKNIYSLAVDERGDLWVGTSLGVNIITNTSAVLTSSNPQFSISTPFSIRQQTINAIAVDPLNRKWVGTNEGLSLLSSDGTQLLATIDSKDYPLLSDVIESLAFDKNAGRLYVGTEAGLTSFDTPAISPVESFNGLNIYPNPFILKDGSQSITIDGLISATDIKIVTISGKLIREFSSPGGKIAYWDGKDNNGKLVGTGIYILIAFDQEGNSVETGKVAVIRE